MRNIKRIFLAFFLVIISVSFSGCGCKQQTAATYKINLEVWGLFDNEDPYRDTFDAFIKQNPSVGNIRYKKMTPDSYQKDLVDALASGQGPDIFLIHNNWLPSFSGKVYPAPASIITEQKVRNDFVDVVADDFVAGGNIYALPLSVDSLGLYYNKDLFNEAGITTPPKNWDEFVDTARKLTKFDAQSQIVQAGAAMGTAANINRATDVLGLLMLQNNTLMADSSAQTAVFDRYVSTDGKTFSPGENALNFYTQFANRSSQSVPYVWNPKMHYSIDAFSEGTLGMMFNYSWQMEVVESKSPKLNYAVAPVPQFPGTKQVNFANYWGYAVAKSRIPDTKGMDKVLADRVTNDMRATEAWKLLTYMTTKFDPTLAKTTATAGNIQSPQAALDPAKDYLEKTKKPAARRDLVEMQKTDVKYGVFAAGNLLAKNWYQISPDQIEALFSQMITQINNGEATVADGLRSASLAVTQMMSK